MHTFNGKEIYNKGNLLLYHANTFYRNIFKCNKSCRYISQKAANKTWFSLKRPRRKSLVSKWMRNLVLRGLFSRIYLFDIQKSVFRVFRFAIFVSIRGNPWKATVKLNLLLWLVLVTRAQI